jgi:AcrR family transcriptional regulator
MKEKKEIEKNASTEQKIKEAAKRVFTQKGYAATRTRDIAEESGYNLALINYYFRSKEKLFDIIMLEQIQAFVQSIFIPLNDRSTTFFEKIDIIVGHYIDMLIKNPGAPIFMLNEVKTDPQKLIARLGMDKVSMEFYIVQQWKEYAAHHKLTINPLHIMVNMVAMTVFPFVASPLLKNRTGITDEQFNTLMEERKQLIPMWIKGMIEAGSKK